MGVDLLLVLFFQTEQHLDGGVALLDTDDALLDVKRHLRGVLINMGSHILAVDLLLGNAVLVDTEGC